MTTHEFHQKLKKHNYKFICWRGVQDAIVEKDNKIYIASEDFPNLTDNPDSILIYNAKEYKTEHYPEGNPIEILVN